MYGGSCPWQWEPLDPLELLFACGKELRQVNSVEIPCLHRAWVVPIVTINFLTLMAHMRWKVIPENLLNGLEGSTMCLWCSGKAAANPNVAQKSFWWLEWTRSDLCLCADYMLCFSAKPSKMQHIWISFWIWYSESALSHCCEDEENFWMQRTTVPRLLTHRHCYHPQHPIHTSPTREASCTWILFSW